MGAVERLMVLNSYRENLPIPDKIANKPELQFGLFFYLQAFLDLNSERNNGFGIGHIPHSKIRNYAAWAQCDEETEHTLLHHIAVMDADHIKRTMKKQERENKHGKPTRLSKKVR